MLPLKMILALFLVLGTSNGVGGLQVRAALGQAQPAVTDSPDGGAVGAAQGGTPAAPGADDSGTEEGDQATVEPEAIIPAGQEALLAEMAGNGATLPGPCTFEGGKIEGTVIKSTYKCPEGEVVFELRHPGTAPANATQTAKFALILQSGSPPTGLPQALVSLIRSKEAAFEWEWTNGPARAQSAQRSLRVSSLAAAGVVGGVALASVVRRRGRRATKP